MWKRNTFCECVKWNDVYNEVLVELWEWLTSSHSFMLPNYKYAAWLFYVIPMMLTCHFHIINWRVDCVCVNVMDRQRYVFWIYSWSELVQYMCTMFLDPLNPGKMSRSIYAMFSASWRVNQLIPRNAVTTAVVIPRHLFKNILPFNSVYNGSLCYSSLSVFVDLI